MFWIVQFHQTRHPGRNHRCCIRCRFQKRRFRLGLTRSNPFCIECKYQLHYRINRSFERCCGSSSILIYKFVLYFYLVFFFFLSQNKKIIKGKKLHYFNYYLLRENELKTKKNIPELLETYLSELVQTSQSSVGLLLSVLNK